MMNREGAGVSSGSLGRMSSARDPYREDSLDAVPAELYVGEGRRHSVSESFRLDARGQPVFFPWRTACVTAGLFALGLVLLLVGALHLWDKDRAGGISLVTVGSLAFLPGAYAAYNLWHAVRGTPGFHLSEIAHYDDFRW